MIKCLHSIIQSVFVGREDLFIAPIDITCMLGKGTCNHYYSVCVSLWEREIERLHIIILHV